MKQDHYTTRYVQVLFSYTAVAEFPFMLQYLYCRNSTAKLERFTSPSARVSTTQAQTTPTSALKAFFPALLLSRVASWPEELGSLQVVLVLLLQGV